MEDNGFVTGLFNVQVKDKKGQLTTTYHDYLKNHHQGPWWSRAMNWVENLFKKDEVSKTKEDIDPYNLTKSENNIAGMIRNDVSVSVNKKTGVISIEVEAQDPLICKIVADSVTEHLQNFITDYRTSKARTDFEYYSGLAKDAKQEYETVRRKYGSLSDANTKVSMKSVELMLEDYENDMQLKFNAYTAINTQLQAAKAKVQENTPAFTILKGASVPIRPAGPKRMIFVAIMLFLAGIVTSLYIIRDLIFKE
jgi:capsule polysaccharide export protein KpsE/RkpR